MQLQFLAPVELFPGGFFLINRKRVVCHIHTLLCRRERSTIVEGQMLGTVYIMEGTCSRLCFLLRNMRHVHIHIQIQIRIHVYIHVRVRVCLCFFVAWCHVMSCAARCWLLVGWLGGWVVVVVVVVVWCVVVDIVVVVLVLGLSCFV